MHYLKMIAVGVLFAGLTGAVAQNQGQWKLGVGALTSAANMEDFHMGVGGKGVIAMERPFGTETGMAADSRLGVRGNFLNYEPQDGAIANSFQEYGAALEAMIGPTGRFFEPKVGGHVGYMRVEEDGPRAEDNLDVGADILATYRVTPRLDLQAMVTPLWLISEDDTDYQTRGSVSLEFQLGPGV